MFVEFDSSHKEGKLAAIMYFLFAKVAMINI